MSNPSKCKKDSKMAFDWLVGGLPANQKPCIKILLTSIDLNTEFSMDDGPKISCIIRSAWDDKDNCTVKVMNQYGDLLLLHEPRRTNSQ